VLSYAFLIKVRTSSSMICAVCSLYGFVTAMSPDCGTSNDTLPTRVLIPSCDTCHNRTASITDWANYTAPSKVCPKPHGPQWADRHQLTLRDHKYRASASLGVSVHFTGHYASTKLYRLVNQLQRNSKSFTVNKSQLSKTQNDIFRAITCCVIKSY